MTSLTTAANPATRTLRSYGLEHLYLHGLAKGPDAGWVWDGSTLSHPTGIRLRMAPDAARRITAAIAAYVPARQEIRTGLQIDALPDAERQSWLDGLDHARSSDDEYRGYRYGGYTTDDGVHVYTRITSPAAGTCEFDTSEVVEIVRGR